MLTVDAEALPRRASQDHVKRLIWGMFDTGTAGIREICSIGDEFKAKHVCFVDLCGAYPYRKEMVEVVRWLDDQGQDVQLHAHPEVLHRRFWEENGFCPSPALMNEYRDDARAEFVIRHFGAFISDITRKSIVAFRAGSFRWNACTIRALRSAEIPLSFNNSMRAFRAGRCVHSEPTNWPYSWSNGVIEIPVSEMLVPAACGRAEAWVSLTYPESPYFRYPEREGTILSRLFRRRDFAVLLLHSWSLLQWDDVGHAAYRDDQRLEGYRRLVARVSRDFDVITARDFLDLHARGKIRTRHAVDVSLAESGK